MAIADEKYVRLDHLVDFVSHRRCYGMRYSRFERIVRKGRVGVAHVVVLFSYSFVAQ